VSDFVVLVTWRPFSLLTTSKQNKRRLQPAHVGSGFIIYVIMLQRLTCLALMWHAHRVLLSSPLHFTCVHDPGMSPVLLPVCAWNVLELHGVTNCKDCYSWIPHVGIGFGFDTSNDHCLPLLANILLRNPCNVFPKASTGSKRNTECKGSWAPNHGVKGHLPAEPPDIQSHM
jgi:hypothetical protein